MYGESERYYERELAFISSSKDPLARYFAEHFPAEAAFADHFAKQFPAKAGGMGLEAGMSVDPHAEWWIQGFAMLAGRIHQKIADEFPQLPEAMLGLFYPHLLMPIPSMAVAQFEPELRNVKDPCQTVPAKTQLRSFPVGSPPTRCYWQTAYDVNVWPIHVVACDIRIPAHYPEIIPPQGTAAILRLRLETKTAHRFADLSIDKLRFFLDADREVVATLYELLLNGTLKIAFHDPQQPVTSLNWLEAGDCLAQVGFALNEGVLPFPSVSFVGYRMLMEFFAFPQKFSFVDISGFDHAVRLNAGRQLELLFAVNDAPENVTTAVDNSTFQLGCTPVVNSFSRIAEPIDFSHRRTEYKVNPGRGFARNGLEILSVDKVSTYEPATGGITEFQPFYAFKHDQSRESHRAYWFARRHKSHQPNVQTMDVYLTLVDRDFNPHQPAEQAVNVRVTCSNGELPHQFVRVGSTLFLQESSTKFAGAIQLIHAPSRARRPPLRQGTFWRWLSQAAMGHKSFSDDDGIDALKETLFLCSAFTRAGEAHRQAVTQQMIDGITGFESSRDSCSIRRGQRVSICRGMKFTLELDRRKYVGTGTYLFASLLEHFLGLYANVNSFSRLQLRTSQGKGILKKWPPRAAENLLA